MSGTAHHYRGSMVHIEIAKLRADLTEAERQLAEARAALSWGLRQFQGESGTGETYWETVPGYADFKRAAHGGGK